MFEALLILLYIGCGVLTYGITVGYFAREFVRLHHEKSHHVWNIIMGLVMGVMGPVGLLVAYPCSIFAKYGLLFNPFNREAVLNCKYREELEAEIDKYISL